MQLKRAAQLAQPADGGMVTDLSTIDRHSTTTCRTADWNLTIGMSGNKIVQPWGTQEATRRNTATPISKQRGGSSSLELSRSSDGGNGSLYLRQGSSAFKPPRSSGGGNQSSSYQRQDSSASSQQLWNERDFLFRQPAESSYQHTRHGSAMQISTDVPDSYEY